MTQTTPESPLLTARAKQLLSAEWDSFAHDLMTRHGPDEENPAYREHKVRDNPLLRTAIYEMRDEYWALLKEFLQRLGEPDKTLLGEQLKSQTQTSIICHTEDCVQRLQKKNYGFTDEQAAAILATAQETDDKAPEQKGMTQYAAETLTGSVISRCLKTFSRTLHPELEPYVPLAYRNTMNLSLHAVASVAYEVTLFAKKLEELGEKSTAATRVIALSKELSNTCAGIKHSIEQQIQTLPGPSLHASRIHTDDVHAKSIVKLLKEIKPHLATLARAPEAEQRYGFNASHQLGGNVIGLSRAVTACLQAEERREEKHDHRRLEHECVYQPMQGLSFQEHPVQQSLGGS
jgi:hypothetical protein